ncbi:MAG TPA: 3D domain-containing protein [Polyangiaceae bacterium]|nr:3D domain-containing protein [Polyangiaceae bacterium]
MNRPENLPSGGAALALVLALVVGCNTAGSDWMAQPLEGELTNPPPPGLEAEQTSAPGAQQRGKRTHVIGEAPPPDLPPLGASAGAGSGYTQGGGASKQQLAGKVLGTFKNTYYDFPSEGDFEGEALDLMNGSCKAIATVPRTFYESVCVQGSGTLKSGGTVSFAKRDCSCAALCPRTGQHICFDLLDKQRFPWGRGATGKGITPLLTVAVDSTIIPLGTPLYIPEYDGLPRDSSGGAKHDGCFLAEDRGLAVKGEHVDVFTGHRETTQLWNRLVPSNRGVTVVVDSPRCRRAG